MLPLLPRPQALRLPPKSTSSGPPVAVKIINHIFHTTSDITTMATPNQQTPVQKPAAAAPAAPALQELVPGVKTLLQAARLAIKEDRPIMLDYYVDTANAKAFLGEDESTKERVLVKSSEEFTSLVQKFYKVDEDYLILTENSIYIVHGRLQKRKISMAALQGDDTDE